MKRLSTLLDFATVFAAVLLFSACGNRHHALKQTTAYIGGDGSTNRVVNVEFDSGIRLVGQKLELADLELTEEVGKDGWKYGVGASSATATPEATYLPFIADMFKSSQLAQARSSDPALSDADKDLLEQIPKLRADMAAIREAIDEQAERGSTNTDAPAPTE